MFIRRWGNVRNSGLAFLPSPVPMNLPGLHLLKPWQGPGREDSSSTLAFLPRRTPGFSLPSKTGCSRPQLSQPAPAYHQLPTLSREETQCGEWGASHGQTLAATGGRDREGGTSSNSSNKETEENSHLHSILTAGWGNLNYQKVTYEWLWVAQNLFIILLYLQPCLSPSPFLCSCVHVLRLPWQMTTNLGAAKTKNIFSHSAGG